MSTLLIAFITLCGLVTVTLAALSVAALFDVKWLQEVFNWLLYLYGKWMNRK